VWLSITYTYYIYLLYFISMNYFCARIRLFRFGALLGGNLNLNSCIYSSYSNSLHFSSNSFDWISAWNISILASFAKAMLAISEARNRGLKSEVWSPKSEAQNKIPYRRATYVGSFEASVLAHVALRMLADTLHRWVTLLLLIFILDQCLKSEVWSPFTASVN
jgi:hypothetical protein